MGILFDLLKQYTESSEAAGTAVPRKIGIPLPLADNKRVFPGSEPGKSPARVPSHATDSGTDSSRSCVK